MKYLAAALFLVLGCASAALAAEIKLLSPADKSVLKGTVRFEVRPELSPGESFLSSPELTVKNEQGQEVQKMRMPRNQQKGTNAVQIDTKTLKDGLYLVTIVYPTLVQLKMEETQQDLSFGIRNGSGRPGKFVVELPEKPAKVGEGVDFTVRVYDQYNRRMPAARVEYKVDKGDLDTNAEISDSRGETFATLNSDDAGTLTLTITVEGLPSVTKTVKFVE